ncbi:MAG: hypothetical protein QG604_564 [Candidatus Dependentiae bacterium]|nr:hypothetical protein [Candidatus Dependentiae bacterium]
MRIKPKRLPYLRQALRICGIILAVPLIAWLAEFAYNNYVAPYHKESTAQYMILSNHGHEGYDYTKLNALLRKMRRIEMHYNQSLDLNNETFQRRINQTLEGLDEENRSFITYYYSILDLYTQANMPIKLRRRLHYYRTIIRHSIGFLRQLQQELGMVEQEDMPHQGIGKI